MNITSQANETQIKLKCINSSGQKVLEKGKLYTLLNLDGDRVYINEYKRYSFLLSRFEVVNE